MPNAVFGCQPGLVPCPSSSVASSRVIANITTMRNPTRKPPWARARRLPLVRSRPASSAVLLRCRGSGKPRPASSCSSPAVCRIPLVPPRRRLSRCRHRRSLRAAATTLPPLCCAPLPRFALPPSPPSRHAAADVALSRCRHCQRCTVALPTPPLTLPLPARRCQAACRAAATALPPSRCAPPPRFSLPQPPLTLPPTRHRRHAAADVALPPPSQPPHCRHRAATVALCTQRMQRGTHRHQK